MKLGAGGGILWVLGAIGCTVGDSSGESATDPPACADGSPAMTMGTGESAYAPMADGAQAVIVQGAQGGWHLWTAAELTGVGPQVTVVGSAVLIENGLVLASADEEPAWIDLANSPGGALYDAEACTGSFFGLETRLDDFVPPGGSSTLEVICALVNREIAFTVTVTDVGSGASVTDTRTVLGHPDETTASSCRAMN
jgi:hypothetical protein